MEVLGKGSVQQLDQSKDTYRCRRWKLVVWVKENNEKQRKVRRFFGSHKDAKEALIDFMNDLENDCVLRSIKFSECATGWFKEREATKNFSPNTLSFDKKNVRRLIDIFGNYYLSELTTEKIQKKLNRLTYASDSNKQLSGTYKSKLYDTLNLILKLAVKKQYILANPMDNVVKPKKDTEERRALSKTEFDYLLKLLDRQQLDGRIMAIYMLMHLGLRRGEVVALTWNDIDWDEHTVHIHRAFKAANRSIGLPKSKAGNRTLPLSDSLYKKLKEWKTVVEKELGETEYICCNTLGNLLYTESLYDWWIAWFCHFFYG